MMELRFILISLRRFVTPTLCWMTWLVAAVLTLSLDSRSLAENAPDLRSLRLDYRKKLLSALLPEKQLHHEQLLSLEHSLVAKGDYAGAIRVREERRAIDEEITATENENSALALQSQALRTSALPERTLFLARDALYQDVVLDPQGGALMTWKTAKSSARWKMPDLPPGGYEIIVTYSNQPSGASETHMLFKEAFYSLACQLTPTSGKRVEMNVGTLRVKDGAGSLYLEMAPPPASGDLRIFSVALTPANR